MNSGLILLDKRPGLTSFEALGEVKRALGTGKVGHTGTLDKFASGLLVVLVGRALKLSSWFSHCDKRYTGAIRFGIETDTLDPEGKTIAEAEVPAREKIEQALSQFSGEIMQAPPAYSAIHINGKRASNLARSGQTPEMKKRPVLIHKLELLSWQPPFADIYVHCSSGTYIRSLARDIALAAGSRAYLSALRRTQVAGFTLEPQPRPKIDGSPLDITEKDVSSLLTPHSPFPISYSPLPINKQIIAMLGLPWFEVTPLDAEKIIHGKPLEPLLEGKELFSKGQALTETAPDFSAAVFSAETLVAIVEKTGGGWKYGCVMGART